MNAQTILRLALIGTVIAVFTHTRADPDLWGHVRFGHDIAVQHRIPDVDPYSFTSDRAWINHEWLAECVMAIAYRAAGPAGLIALKVLLLAAMAVLIAHGLRTEGVGDRARDLLIGVVVIGTIAQANHVRPQLFSLVMFAALLWLLVTIAGGRTRAAWLVPPLMILWTNVHGGWILGVGVLVLWIAGGLVAGGRRTETIALLAAGAVAIPATLINPYGWRLWTFLHETVGFGRADITDWQPVYRMGAFFVVLWVSLVALAGAAVRRALAAGDVDVRRTTVVLTLAILAFRVNRLLAFLALALVMLMGPALASLLASRRTARGAAASGRLASATAFAVAAALLLGSAYAAAVNVRCVRVEPDGAPEADVTAFALREHASGRMVTWFDWGEYAIWHLGRLRDDASAGQAPAVKVSMDGRRETVYSDARVQEHLRFYFDPPVRRAFLDRWQPDYIWLPRRLPVVPALIGDGWVTLAAGDQSILLGRPGAATRGPSDARSVLRCFPGP